MTFDIAGLLLAAARKDFAICWAAITSHPWTFLMVVGLVVLIVIVKNISPRRRRSRSSYRRY